MKFSFRPAVRPAFVATAILTSVFSSQPSFAASDCILDNCADRRPLAAPQDAPQDSPQQAPDAAVAPAQPARNYGGYGYGYGGRDRIGPRGASAPGDFDFYVLALSWSPGFCATGGAAKSRNQCASGARLGFVVHGLWPQYERGFPSDCASGGYVSSLALASARGLFPDPGLARYEWRKHGTCSGKSPVDYFTDLRDARDAVIVPAAFNAPQQDQTLAPNDIQRAFLESNPRLRPGMMAVTCKGGALEEVRICFSKDVRDFRPCPQVTRSGCFSQSILVPAPQ